VPEDQSEAVQSSSGETVSVQDGVVEETLVEEVSIDGMCGVY
jgi:mycofactocin precursor